MESQALLMLLVLAIAVMAGYYYFKRAQSRRAGDQRPDDGHDGGR